MSRVPEESTVLKRLRLEILTGALAAGEHLSEPMIAKRFGASRTPVGEAFFALRGELVHYLGSKRAPVVRTLSEREVCEIFAMIRAFLVELTRHVIRGYMLGPLAARYEKVRQSGDVGDGSIVNAVAFLLSFAEYFNELGRAFQFYRMATELRRCWWMLHLLGPAAFARGSIGTLLKELDALHNLLSNPATRDPSATAVVDRLLQRAAECWQVEFVQDSIPFLIERNTPIGADQNPTLNP